MVEFIRRAVFRRTVSHRWQSSYIPVIFDVGHWGNKDFIQ